MLGTSIFEPLALLVRVYLAARTAALLDAKMAATAGPMGGGSNNFDGELGGDTPSQNIVWLLLELDTCFVSASAAVSTDLSCVN